MEGEKLVAVITGAGSGIGYEISRLLLEKGWEVWDLSRTDRAHTGVRHMSCDVSNEDRVITAINLIHSRSGHIDLLISNAGFGISGAVEFTSSESAARLMAVNLMGADNVTRAVIPYMRENEGGRIIYISSAAAAFPIPFQAWYSASKAALNSYALALRNELKPFDISVCVLMPGDIHTGFTAKREKSVEGDDIYSGRIDKAVSVMERDETNGMDPAYVAAQVLKCVYASNPAPLKTVGGKYKLFMLLKRLLPERFVNFLLGSIYS
ncbi:MAG: SDR family NAD(P)-dependent oxidoreductase [Clostridia bacterium]|nr:SDR family NAD(P)-dependent oxidoreductase [Clostridia bacterium]